MKTACSPSWPMGPKKTYLVEESKSTCWLRDGAWNADGSKIIYTEICGGSSPTNWDAEGRTARIFVYDFADESSTELIPAAEFTRDRRWN